MKTLYEGILANMEDTMKSGDNLDKLYKKANKELDDIKKRFRDLSKWEVYDKEIAVHYTTFINCSKLSRYFDFIGKNILLEVTYYPKGGRWTGWVITYKFTNANMAHYEDLPWGQNRLYVKHYNKAVEYQHPEIGHTPVKDNDSKYTFEQIIEKLVMPKFENMEIFKSEIVNPYKEIENENDVTNYIKGANI